MTAIDEIKARIDIVDLVSETVKLRHAGKNYTGFCPFHPNSRTPAFVVFPDSGTWRCFGQCNEGGDAFKFVMKKEGWDFTQALRYLADRAGVQLEAVTPNKQAEDEQFERLHRLLEDTVVFYQHHLTNTPDGKKALEYLTRRGLLPGTIESFGLGYAPESWDAALQYLVGKGYQQDELLSAGLVSERQGGSGVYDRFRNRIMFPIRDGLGHMCGFGARILNPNDIPKFLNSPQTLLFDKGRLLYGLDAARKAIRAQDQVVIVEGYLDVIALHQGGFTNTVSPMGTALTEDQLRMLKRFSRRIVLALDADAAGEKATLRGLEVARQSLDRAEELTFDARGLLRHEARLQADVRVTTLPPGMDPDEVVLRDSAEWARILEAAQPIVIHVMETLAAGHNLEDPKAKTEIAAQVLPLIEDVPSPIERDAYRQRLARLLRVDERSLVGAGSKPVRPSRRASASGSQTGSAQKPVSDVPNSAKLALTLEKQCLWALLRQPDGLYLLDRALQQAELYRFSTRDFEHADHQLLAEIIQHSIEQEEMEPHEYIHENVPDSLQDLMHELQSPLKFEEPNDEKRMEDLIDGIARLRYIRLTENINQIRFLQEEAQQQGQPYLDMYKDIFLEYIRLRDRLDRTLGKRIQFQ